MLYIISTPIGNILDIFPRALDTIRKSDIIISEDTRISVKLLSFYGITKKIIRYNENSEKSIQHILNLLLANKNISLVTDAGTPTISDPGWKLINLARKYNIKIEVIGGNSALIIALAGSGFDVSKFTFLGFLPRSQSKMKKMLMHAFSAYYPIVIYESPNRIIDLLLFIKENFGDIDCVVARELTKIHEEWLYGTISDVIKKLKEKDEILGEISLVLSPFKTNSKITSIGFVCMGNTCRSVMAEMYAKKLVLDKKIDVNISSAGIYVNENLKVSDSVIKVLKKEGIEILNQNFPRQIDKFFIESNDLILTMTKEYKKKLVSFFPEYENKIFTLSQYSGIGGDIYDPYGKDYMFYEMVFGQIKKAVDMVINKFENNKK